MRAMTYRSASQRAQRALLAIGAGLTLAVAAAPVAQATPARALAAGGTCVANANGMINSGGAAAGATSTCSGGTISDAVSMAGGKGKGKGKGGTGAGGDTGHKVG